MKTTPRILNFVKTINLAQLLYNDFMHFMPQKKLEIFFWITTRKTQTRPVMFRKIFTF